MVGFIVSIAGEVGTAKMWCGGECRLSAKCYGTSYKHERHLAT
jgi:hypothetical protein